MNTFDHLEEKLGVILSHIKVSRTNNLAFMNAYIY